MNLKQCPSCGIEPFYDLGFNPFYGYYVLDLTCKTCNRHVEVKVSGDSNGVDFGKGEDALSQKWNKQPYVDKLKAEIALKDEQIEKLESDLPSIFDLQGIIEGNDNRPSEDIVRISRMTNMELRNEIALKDRMLAKACDILRDNGIYPVFLDGYNPEESSDAWVECLKRMVKDEVKDES